MRPVLLRSEESPGDDIEMIRAGAIGVSVEVLRRTATDNHDDLGFYGGHSSPLELSVDVVVGAEDAESAVAHVVDVDASGVVFVRVLTGPAEAHLELIGPRPA